MELQGRGVGLVCVCVCGPESVAEGHLQRVEVGARV